MLQADPYKLIANENITLCMNGAIVVLLYKNLSSNTDLGKTFL